MEVSRGMQLDQVKRKIPSVLFCWDTYSASREGQSAQHVNQNGQKMPRASSLSKAIMNAYAA